MAVHTTHTLLPNATVPYGIFDEDNIEFVQNKAAEFLLQEFAQRIIFDRADVIRVMKRMIEVNVESIPRMNRRVVMELCREFREHQYEVNLRLNQAENYVHSQRLYDPVGHTVRFDTQKLKLANRLGEARVGGTLRFYFT